MTSQRTLFCGIRERYKTSEFVSGLIQNFRVFIDIKDFSIISERLSQNFPRPIRKQKITSSIASAKYGGVAKKLCTLLNSENEYQKAIIKEPSGVGRGGNAGTFPPPKPENC